MTQRYGLRARVMTLTLAPTLIIGLLLSALFSFNRYHDLETQVINSGASIIEPLAIASEDALRMQSRESVRRIISYAHRKNSKLVRSIAVFDANHELFVTSNFHPNFEKLMYPKDKPIPFLSSSVIDENTLILRTPIISERTVLDNGDANPATPVMGYIAIELDLSSLRLQQYQEIFFRWFSASDRDFAVRGICFALDVRCDSPNHSHEKYGRPHSSRPFGCAD